MVYDTKKLLGFWTSSMVRNSKYYETQCFGNWKETDPVSETLCFIVFKIVHDGQSPKLSNSECQLQFVKYSPVLNMQTTRHRIIA
jgi:hypothetical protein